VGGAQKRAGVRGWATWPGISACVRVAGPQRVMGKAELTGGSHGAARGSRRARKTVRRADKSGPRGREGKGARGQGQLAPTERPYWVEGEGEGRALRETAADRWSPPVRRRGRAHGPAGLDWASLGCIGNF
jgi:hypothetical protein